MSSTSADRRASGLPRRRLVLLGAALVVMSVAWALAAPLFTSPDETSHVIKAAAVARGQVWTPPADAEPTRDRPGGAAVVRVPAGYAEAPRIAACTAFKPEVTAECVEPLPEGGGTGSVETYAGQYPPLYYALVGWPSLLDDGDAGVYGMRLVSALLGSALLLAGVAVLPRSSGWTGLAVATAVSPMVLFLAATVNPNGLEVCAAAAFWCALLGLTTDPDGPVERRLVLAGVAGAVLVNVRATGPVVAVVTVVVALLVTRRGALRRVVRARAAVPVLVLGVLSSVTSVGWLLAAGTTASAADLYPEYANPVVTARASLGRTERYVEEMIGTFGWLDTPAPLLTYSVWGAAALLLLVLAVSSPSRRDRAAVAAMVLLLLAVPSLVQVPQAEDVGLVWQGRYALPLAVGAVLLAGLVAPRWAVPVLARPRTVVVVALGIGHVGAFYWVLHRYAVGIGGELVFLDPTWEPPGGYVGLQVVHLAAVVAWTVLLLRLDRAATAPDGPATDAPDRPTDDRPTDDRPTSEARSARTPGARRT